MHLYRNPTTKDICIEYTILLLHRNCQQLFNTTFTATHIQRNCFMENCVHLLHNIIPSWKIVSTSYTTSLLHGKLCVTRTQHELCATHKQPHCVMKNYEHLVHNIISSWKIVSNLYTTSIMCNSYTTSLLHEKLLAPNTQHYCFMENSDRAPNTQHYCFMENCVQLAHNIIASWKIVCNSYSLVAYCKLVVKEKV